MATEVYWGSGSGPSWRVLLGFVVKGLPYESRLISFSTREHKAPAFLAMNPRGKVPTVRDGDFVLNESLAILAWLDAKHPEAPLFGTTPAETGQVWRRCLEFENHVWPTAQVVSRPLLFGQFAEKEAEVRAGIPAFLAELDAAEAALAATGHFVGDRISAADLVWFVGLHTWTRAASRPAAEGLDLPLAPMGARYPRLLALARKIEALPGYDATFPPHWRVSDPPSSATLE